MLNFPGPKSIKAIQTQIITKLYSKAPVFQQIFYYADFIPYAIRTVDTHDKVEYRR